MKQLGRFVSLALAGVLGGCGGDSTGNGPQAASVTGVAGDNQSGPTGSALAFPLSFIALDGSGHPVQGVQVSWSASPTGAATFNPSTGTTDATGSASTAVTLGSVVGSITIQAAVTGVQDVVYHVTALNPCDALNPYALGDTVNGALTHADCRITQGNLSFRYDFYELDLPDGQQSIRIKEAPTGTGSSQFDPYVELFLRSGALTGWDDDIQNGVIQTSQLDIILGTGGQYVIGATSFDADTVGPYQLTSSTRPANVSGCRDVWMTPGATFTDTIRANDCADSTSRFADIIYMYMQPNQAIRIAERSTVINPLLQLYTANFQTQRFDSVAANDDSVSGNTNAYLSYTVPSTTSRWYLLVIGTAAPNDTGEYTLTFSPLAPSSRQSAPRDRMLPVLPSGTFRGWKRHPE